MNTNIEDYLSQASTGQKMQYERLKKIVKQVVPEFEEVISYGIPTFKFKKKNLIHFGIFKDHMSLFPTAKPITSLQEKLQDFATAKGTIQFTEDKPVPEELIRELLVIRINEIIKV